MTIRLLGCSEWLSGHCYTVSKVSEGLVHSCVVSRVF